MTASAGAAIRGPLFSVKEAFQYGMGVYKSEAWRCFGFLLAVEITILVASVSVSMNICAMAQLITQLDSQPPDMFWYVVIPTYAILRCCAQVLVNKWLLLVSEGRVISWDEVLGFDSGYHFAAMLKMLAASFIFNFFAIVGSALFIMPGVYAASTLRFYKFLIVDRDADAVEGLRESYELCTDNKAALQQLTIVSAIMKVAGFLCFGIGYIPASAVCGLAEAYAYKRLLQAYDQEHAAVPYGIELN